MSNDADSSLQFPHNAVVWPCFSQQADKIAATTKDKPLSSTSRQYPEYSLIQGQIYEEKDGETRGMEDVMVALWRSQGSHNELDAVETGLNGMYQFSLDALDLIDTDSTSDEFHL